MNTVISTASTNPKMSGDGDGIQQITPIRHPVPSSRKFSPTSKSKRDIKSKLEVSLKEMKTPNKKQGTRSKNRVECSSVDTPVKITNRKCFKSTRKNDVIKVYCSPRESRNECEFSGSAAQIVFKYLLLNSWRKSRERCSKLNSLVSIQHEKINQLNMQVDVLQNLRKSENLRKEGILAKYRELQKNFDYAMSENETLKNLLEKLDRDKCSLLSELESKNNETLYYEQEIDEKTRLLKQLEEKSLNENYKLKENIKEINNLKEHNYKLENIINIQKENLENMKLCVEKNKKQEIVMREKLERSEEIRRNDSEKIQLLILNNEECNSRIIKYEIENNKLNEKMKSLQEELNKTRENCDDLKKDYDFLNLEILKMKTEFENEKRLLWNLTKKGANTTYSVIKYLADKIVPALQANFII